MNLYGQIDSFMANMANALWGTPLVILLLGGGIYFSIISKLAPFKYLNHELIFYLGNMTRKMTQVKLLTFKLYLVLCQAQ